MLTPEQVVQNTLLLLNARAEYAKTRQEESERRQGGR